MKKIKTMKNILRIKKNDQVPQHNAHTASNRHNDTLLSHEIVMDFLSDFESDVKYFNHSTIMFNVYIENRFEPITTLFGGMDAKKGPYFFKRRMLGDDLVCWDGNGTEPFDVFYYVKDKKRHYLKDYKELQSHLLESIEYHGSKQMKNRFSNHS